MNAMIPNAIKHNPSSTYIRFLIAETGLTHQQVADTLGISRYTIQRYLSGSNPIPYLFQFALEALAKT